MFSNLRLTNKLWLVISIPLLSELLFVGTLVYLLNSADAAAVKEQRSKAVIAETVKIQESFFRQVSTLAAYGVARTEVVRKRFDAAIEELPRRMNALKRLATATERERAAVVSAEHAMNRSLDLFVRVRDQLEESAMLVGGKELRRELKECTDQLFPALEQIALEEKINSGDPTTESNLRLFIQNFLCFGLALNMLVVLLLVSAINKGIVKRMHVLVENAQRFAGGLQLSESLDGKDEFSHLDQSFRHMASTITEAARRERTLVDNATDVICSLSEELKFTSVSPACLHLWGKAPVELKNSSVGSILSSNSLEKFRATITKRENDQVPQFEWQVERPDGSTLDTWWSVIWSEAEQAYFCVVHDVTERKELERRRKELVAIVSHDLRAPLSAVSCNLTLLAEGVRGELAPPALKEVLDAERNVARLMRLVKDILDMEKMDSGKMELSFHECDLLDLIDQSEEAVRQLAAQANVSITVDAEDIQLTCDADRIIQVLVNILSNAIKYSPQGGQIKVEASVSDQFQDRVTFRVSDQGPGIPEDYFDKVFDRFRQVDGASKTAKSGTGLGLTIAQEIVHLHGGQIGVDSTLGSGSSFWFTIPIQQVV